MGLLGASTTGVRGPERGKLTTHIGLSYTNPGHDSKTADKLALFEKFCQDEKENRTWLKRPRELDHRLRIKNEKLTLRMQQAVRQMNWVSTTNELV